MRDRVTLTFGRREYRLLPAFSVQDGFEDRCGALTGHLINLVSGTATLRARGTLVYLGMKAAMEADGEGTSALTIQSVMESMWEAGSADNSLLLKEQEFIERLLYTPEQYAAKKAEREKAEAAQKVIEDLLSASPDYSGSPPPFSDGNLPSFGNPPPESSSQP